MFKKRSLLAIFVSILVAGTSTFGTLMYLDRRDYRNYLQNQYERNLYDLTTDVENLQVALSKVEIAGSPKRSLLLFGEIWNEASTAQYRLNTLPISHVAISQTSKFLSQVGDFSFALLRAVNSGASLSQTEMNNVSKLKNYAGYLSKQLHLLESDVAAKKVSMEAIKYSGDQLFSRQSQNPVDVQFQSISQEIQQEYPTLIYDGPFAENVLNIKPRILSSPAVNQEKAKEVAANILGRDKIDSIGIYSDKKGETIPTYSFSVKMKGRKDNNVNIDISKNGGMVVYMLDGRNVGQPKLSMNDASNIGVKFLEKNGYKDMIPTFAMRYDETAVINFVSVRNKVVIYPDQIKLKIALDNGDITGIEAMHYLTAHYDRKITSPRINVSEARKNVSQKINIKNIRLTIIPMESMREVLCYEFYGTYNNERYMVYINAIDGTEEKILKIMETENGELSM